MSERWVCRRCFADNDEADATCHHCRLPRGADPGLDATLGTAGAEGRRFGRAHLLRFGWIAALVVVAAGGYLASAQRDASGAISSRGTLSVVDLRVGDCFSFEDADEISEVDAGPCDEPHHYELFHVATWDGGGDYPDDGAMDTFVLDRCVPAFEAYVGRSYETSRLDFVDIVPTADGWAAGDRVFQCVLVDPAADEVSGSLRGARR